ncbi:MAG: hypothetical protein ACD_40C00060G0001 [uncultured bacterium]|nr:MAG: hypothetical protein ACD_40C00060G0001 [uncultured bacterium]
MPLPRLKVIGVMRWGNLDHSGPKFHIYHLVRNHGYHACS